MDTFKGCSISFFSSFYFGTALLFVTSRSSFKRRRFTQGIIERNSTVNNSSAALTSTAKQLQLHLLCNQLPPNTKSFPNEQICSKFELFPNQFFSISFLLALQSSFTTARPKEVKNSYLWAKFLYSKGIICEKWQIAKNTFCILLRTTDGFVFMN